MKEIKMKREKKKEKSYAWLPNAVSLNGNKLIWHDARERIKIFHAAEVQSETETKSTISKLNSHDSLHLNDVFKMERYRARNVSR